MAGMRKSYYPNYFSLEDIMASEERIPVEVKDGSAPSTIDNECTLTG